MEDTLRASMRSVFRIAKFEGYPIAVTAEEIAQARRDNIEQDRERRREQVSRVLEVLKGAELVGVKIRPDYSYEIAHELVFVNKKTGRRIVVVPSPSHDEEGDPCSLDITVTDKEGE